MGKSTGAFPRTSLTKSDLLACMLYIALRTLFMIQDYVSQEFDQRYLSEKKHAVFKVFAGYMHELLYILEFQVSIESLKFIIITT